MTWKGIKEFEKQTDCLARKKCTNISFKPASIAKAKIDRSWFPTQFIIQKNLIQIEKKSKYNWIYGLVWLEWS